MSFSFLCLYYGSFNLVSDMPQYAGLLYLCEAFFAMSVVLCCVVWLSDPGYLKKSPSFDFVRMLSAYDASSICPDCQVIRTPRSRHCHMCDRCVDRFDHHCPWVNNCVGRGNYRLFYIFITAQTLFLLLVTSLSLLVIVKEFILPECSPKSASKRF